MSPLVTKNDLINENGFTIIEALIAMVIFTIGILAVAQMQIQAISADKRAFEQTEAAMWASNQAETLISLPYDDSELSVGAHDAVKLGPNDKYSLEWEITEAVAGTKTVKITVNWTARNNSRKLEFDYVKVSGVQGGA